MGRGGGRGGGSSRDRIRLADSYRETKSDAPATGSRFSDGNTGQGGDRAYGGLIHGTDAQGNDVTAAFGRDGTKQEGETLMSDGHKDAADFYGDRDDKGHDHYDGRGGGTSRGQYTGEGS